MTQDQLASIAAAAHEPPAGAHLVMVAVIVLAVAIGLVVTRRRHQRSGDPRDRERSEP